MRKIVVALMLLFLLGGCAANQEANGEKFSSLMLYHVGMEEDDSLAQKIFGKITSEIGNSLVVDMCLDD